MAGLQDDLAAQFRWVRGHADMWRWFADGALFDAIVKALASPFEAEGVTKVVGIESRGFLLSGAVARELNVGIVPIRKRGAIFAGPKSSKITAPDYRDRSIELMLQREVLSETERVLLVDDWLETGSQMLAAAAL
jgi:adenine phosphoribosyltransferase